LSLFGKRDAVFILSAHIHALSFVKTIYPLF